ncbi:MAG: hypothetical protein WBM44_31435 [Waterburya sp.]
MVTHIGDRESDLYEEWATVRQNPYPSASLPWATWLIARMGG